MQKYQNAEMTGVQKVREEQYPMRLYNQARNSVGRVKYFGFCAKNNEVSISWTGVT